MRTIYEQAFSRLVRDSNLMPGMGMLDDILSERTAYTWTWLKERDARGPRTRFNPGDYDRMNKLLMQCIQLRINTAKALSVDAMVERHAMRAAAAATIQVIEECATSPEQEARMKAALPAAFAAHLR
jgi:hypothetical protein